MTLFLDGLRFARPLPALIEGLVELRPFVRAAQDSHIARMLATQALLLADRATHAGTTPDQSPLRQAWRALQEQNRERTRDGTRCPTTDTECQWVLFAQGDATLGLFRAEQPAWKAIFSVLDAKDWSWGRYQHPNHLTDADWAQREADWTAAMGGEAAWVPAHRGVVFTYTRPNLAPSVDAVLACAPSVEIRSLGVARDIHAGQVAAQAHANGQDAMEAIWSALGNTAAIAAIAEGIAPTLPAPSAAYIHPTPS